MAKFKKIKLKGLFNEFFGFEQGINISDENQVLFRRNVVIKNIIFVSNVIYTILMFALSFVNSSNSNWILTIIIFPLTFLINSTLKKMVFKNKDDHFHQQIAMYIACFYMFVSSLVIYMKLKMADTSFGEAGYILIYYSLVVISLYQDRKLMITVDKWLLVIVTILHFTVTHDIVNSESNKDGLSQIKDFISSTAFSDIVLRTILLILFMVVLYAIVSISQYMQDERKKELLKRQEVQQDFTKVVTDIFNVTLNDGVITNDERDHIIEVSQMSRKFASILGLPPEQCDDAEKFAKIHLDNKVDLNVENIASKDEQFEYLRSQTTLGNQIVKRLELERRCEEIIRAHEEGFDESQIMDKMKTQKMNELEQIILICDMYTSLRSVRRYKRPFPHKLSIETMETEFRGYFDAYIFERFIRFQDEFQKLHDNF